MPNRLLAAFMAFTLLSANASLAAEIDQAGNCKGLSVDNFESRFPPNVRRLIMSASMLGPFVELWRAGARPALPKRPEQVIIYSLPKLPLIVAYEEQSCVIAYLTVDSAFLWRWLRPRLGWRI